MNTTFSSGNQLISGTYRTVTKKWVALGWAGHFWNKSSRAVTSPWFRAQGTGLKRGKKEPKRWLVMGVVNADFRAWCCCKHQGTAAVLACIGFVQDQASQDSN